MASIKTIEDMTGREKESTGIALQKEPAAPPAHVDVDRSVHAASRIASIRSNVRSHRSNRTREEVASLQQIAEPPGTPPR